MKNISIAVAFFLLNACKQRELFAELPYEGDKMVVFSLLCPSEIINVQVSKTYTPTGKVSYIDGINNAEVLLYENEKFIEKLAYSEKGIYISSTNFKPKSGFGYSLKINSPTLPSITTPQEIIPLLPNIIFYKFDERIESYNKGRLAKKLIIKLQDIKNEATFYYVKVEGFWQNYQSGLSGFSIDQANETESPCNFSYLGSTILSDACFPNSDYEFKKGYELEPVFIINNNTSRKEVDKVVAKVRQINKSYYEFCKTFYDEEGLLKAFNTPFARYNNIKGGYGIFAAYNEILIELPAK